MPRSDANAYTLARIAEDATQPVYFIELGWDTGGGVPLRVSSADVGLLDTLGNSWFSIGARVRINTPNEIPNRVQIVLPDEDNFILGYIDTQGLGITANIYKWYADARTWTGPVDLVNDAMHEFSGIVSAAPTIGLIVVLECVLAVVDRRIPHIYCSPPTNNHNIPAGVALNFFSGSITTTE